MPQTSQNIATSSSGAAAASRSEPAVDVADHPGAAAPATLVVVMYCSSPAPMVGCRDSCCCAAPL
eukprot:8343489-Lingulodinium_polyedra.AAC.1